MSEDLWGISEMLDGILESWDPSSDEVPGEALEDSEWLRSRLLALRFLRTDLEEQTEAFNAEQARLDDRRVQVVGVVETQVANLEDQLAAFHAALIRRADIEGDIAPLTVKTPQGTLRSGAGRVSAKVEPAKAAAAAEWLRENGHDECVTEVPASFKVDLRAVAKLAMDAWSDDGFDVVVNGDGEICPGVTLHKSDRWHKQDT